MALPKEPRQKMINLMYLVLMAMLALNVSAEILNAFQNSERKHHQFKQCHYTKNNLVYQQFEKQLSIDPERVRPIKEKADQVKILCEQMNLYIDSLKKVIIRESGGLNDSGEIKDMSNLDAPSRVMENQGQGPMLEKKIETLREQLLSMYDNPVEREQVRRFYP